MGVPDQPLLCLNKGGLCVLRTQQEYNAGIYCRLSVDDGTNNESMSIGNQKQMLSEYVSKNGWNIEEIYIEACGII